MCSGVEGSVVGDVIDVPVPVVGGLFTGQRVAERAGWPVTDAVHGTIVDGPWRAAISRSHPRPAQCQRAPPLVTGTGLGVSGHKQVRVLRPRSRGRRSRRRPPSVCGRRSVRVSRGRCAGHGARAAAAVGADRLRTSGGPVPLVLGQAFRHEVVPLRRDRLHRVLGAAHQLVVARHRGQRSVRVRPHRKTGPVHG